MLGYICVAKLFLFLYTHLSCTDLH
uniref:Uncharacterized protein n=1 Tax=Anopheles minimus TaxID=112268 RepID=A0A182WPC9_9DIPT